MATIKPVEIDSYVKFPVKGGFAYAKVVSFKEDGKLAVLQTPTDCVTETNTDNLISCTKKEYNKVIKDLAEGFLAKASESEASADNSEAKMNESEAKMKELEAKLAETEAKFQFMEKAKSEAEAKAKDMENAKCEAEAKLAEAMKSYQKAESTLAALQFDIQSKERFGKLASIDAVAAVAASDDEAKKILGEMAEASFNTIYNIAKAQYDKFEQAKAALPKGTDQTQTSLPKGTDQTQTSNPKGTEQTQASVQEIVENTKVENDPALENLASAATSNAFAEFIAGKLTKKTKKVEKKSE